MILILNMYYSSINRICGLEHAMFLTSTVRPSVFLPRNDRMSHDFSFVIIAQSVGVFLYVYFYMCISICVFLHVYFYMCISISVFLHVYFYMCISIYVYFYMCISICVFLHVYFYMCISICVAMCCMLWAIASAECGEGVSLGSSNA
jgi:hypothetical protein